MTSSAVPSNPDKNPINATNVEDGDMDSGKYRLEEPKIPPASETPGPIDKFQDQGEETHITILIHFIS